MADDSTPSQRAVADSAAKYLPWTVLLVTIAVFGGFLFQLLGPVFTWPVKPTLSPMPTGSVQIPRSWWPRLGSGGSELEDLLRASLEKADHESSRIRELEALTVRLGQIVIAQDASIKDTRGRVEGMEKRLPSSATDVAASGTAPKPSEPAAGDLAARVVALEKQISEADIGGANRELGAVQKTLIDVRVQNDRAIDAVRDEIERSAGINRWIIGIMFTLTGGLLALAVTNILKQTPRVAGERPG